MNPNNLLNPKNLLACAVGGVPGIVASVATDAITSLLGPDEITRTTEDKPKPQTVDDNMLDQLKKSSSYLQQITNKGITSRLVPNPEGSKF